MTDEELEKVARDASEAVGGEWEFGGNGTGEAGWVESLGQKSSITPPGCYEGEWNATAGRHAAAFCPATALALLERVRKAEAIVTVAKRSGLLLALKQAEDVEREEVAACHSDSASGAEEVKDRIAERIRWMDEGLE